MATVPSYQPVPATPEQEKLIDNIKSSLSAAIDSRARHYERVFTWSIRFANDDTKAAEDTENFKHFLKAFNLTLSKEQVLPADLPSGLEISPRARRADKSDCESAWQITSDCPLRWTWPCELRYSLLERPKQ